MQSKESRNFRGGGDTLDLYLGEALHVMRNLPNACFDAIITDPPYAAGANVGAKGESTATKYTAKKQRCTQPDFEGDGMDDRTWVLLMSDVLREGRRVCKPGAVCAVFIDWRKLPSLTEALQRAGWLWRGVAVWHKPNSRPQKGRFRQEAEFIVWGSAGRLPLDRPVPPLPGVYQCNTVNTGNRLHQTQKPLELMREIIRITLPGGGILDPFAGSGTTLLAAQLEGHPATGIECCEPIAIIAAERLGVDLKRLHT